MKKPDVQASCPRARSTTALRAQQRVERDVQQHARQAGRDGRRRPAVGVRQPRVHRHEADLGADADEQEHEGPPHHLRVERRGPLPERAERERAVERQAGADAGVGEQQQPEQAHADAERAEQQVLPGRLDGAVLLVERDERRRRQRRRLERDPEDAEMVGGDRDEHRQHEQRQEAVVDRAPCGSRGARRVLPRRCSACSRAPRPSRPPG